jgi:rhamnosyl/mannosyltransferase
MIKVIHLGKFDTSDKGGIENHVYNLCTRLAKNNHYVLNVISNRRFRFKKSINGNFEVVSLPAFFKCFSTAFNVILPFYVMKRVIFDSFNIIHIHHPDPLSHLTTLFLPKKIKIVLTWHSDIVAYKKLYFFYKPFLIKLLLRADRIIVATPNHIKSSDLLSNHNIRKKIQIIPYGIDYNYFNQKKFIEESIAVKRKYNNKFIIFTLSRHVYYKGLPYLIEAMKYTNGALLVIGGSGPDTEKLKQIVIKRDLVSKVIFTGHIPENNLPSYHHAADIFCLPSTESSEAFGIAMAESMACAKPIIVSKLGTGVNFVCTNQTGIIVERGNALALGKAINRLKESSALRKSLGENGQKRIKFRFSTDMMVKKTIRLYRSI